MGFLVLVVFIKQIIMVPLEVPYFQTFKQQLGSSPDLTHLLRQLGSSPDLTHLLLQLGSSPDLTHLLLQLGSSPD